MQILFEQIQHVLHLEEYDQLSMQENSEEDYYKVILSFVHNLLIKYKDLASDYIRLEEDLQNYERQCRDHIKFEYRLKLHCEQLQERCDQGVKEEQQFREIISKQTTEILELKRNLLNLQQLERAENGRSLQNHEKYLDQLIEKREQRKQKFIKCKNKKFILEPCFRNRVKTDIDLLQSIDLSQLQILDKVQDVSSQFSKGKLRIQNNKQEKSFTLHIQRIDCNDRFRSQSYLRK